MAFNPNLKNEKYYWNIYFDVNKRLNILKNNTNFILSDDEIEELVKKKCTFWNKRNLSFRQFIKAYYEDFKAKLIEEIKKLTSLDPNSDVLLLWWNYTRVLEKTIWLDNIIENEKTKMLPKTFYTIDRFSKYEEIKKVLANEYLMLDLETTWFNKLNQIIEFGWIIYNRKITKTEERIWEAKYIANEKLLLSIFKYFDEKYLYWEDWYDIILELSIYWLECQKSKIKLDKEVLKEIISRFDFNYSNLTEVSLLEKFELINNFDLIYNKQIHFYVEHYKDFSNKMNESIHHISNDKRTSVWKKTEDILPALHKLLTGQVVLAHNALFDISKISEFFNDFKYKWPKINKIYDTINLFQIINREMWIGDKINLYNLDYLSKLYLGINLSSSSWDATQDRHTAIYDVKLTNRNVIKAQDTINAYILDNWTPLINDLLKNIWKDKKVKLDKATKNLAVWQIWLF